jgi:pyruvate dehydrogenase E1 component alpha subunit
LSVKELLDVPRAFGIAAEAVDGTDPEAAYGAVERAIEEVRTQRHAFFLEVRTPKWPGNAGADPSLEITGPTDVSLAWNPPAEDRLDAWHRADPVLRLIERCLAERIMEPEDVNRLDEEIRGRLRDAVALARSATMPGAESATLHALASDGFWPPVRAW